MDCKKLKNICINVCKNNNKENDIFLNNDMKFLPIQINSNECLQMKEVFNICCNSDINFYNIKPTKK